MLGYIFALVGSLSIGYLFSVTFNYVFGPWTFLIQVLVGAVGFVIALLAFILDKEPKKSDS